MKIVSFTVQVECGHCNGTGRVSGGQVQYGEVIACHMCHGKRTVEGKVLFEDFAKLITKMAEVRSNTR